MHTAGICVNESLKGMEWSKNMIRNRYVAFGLFVVVALAVWNLLDYLYSIVITRSVYQFAIGSDLGFPVVVAAVVGYLLFLHKKTDER